MYEWNSRRNLTVGFYPAKWQRALHITHQAFHQIPNIVHRPGPILVDLGKGEWKFLLPFEVRNFTCMVPVGGQIKMAIMGSKMELLSIFGAFVSKQGCTRNAAKNYAASTSL